MHVLRVASGSLVKTHCDILWSAVNLQTFKMAYWEHCGKMHINI